jgi:phosphatidylglycerol---prolipoprotein diacylglyceryl transferase
MRPLLFEWRGTRVYSYPAMLYLGLVFGVVAGNAAAHAAGIDAFRTFVATFVLIVVALIGARLLYVACNWRLYRQNLRRIWNRNEGGAAQHGGLALALPVSAPLLSAFHLSPGSFWDVSAFTILVGMVFTRVGCLLNGCCAGRPSTAWGCINLPNHRGVWERRIPTQCLEGALAAALLIAAIRAWQWLPFPGALFLLVTAGYGCGRFVLQSAREQQPGSPRFTVDHYIAVIMILLPLAVLSIRWPK